jgi:hypothetical protein
MVVPVPDVEMTPGPGLDLDPADPVSRALLGPRRLLEPVDTEPRKPAGVESRERVGPDSRPAGDSSEPARTAAGADAGSDDGTNVTTNTKADAGRLAQNHPV